MSADGMKMTAVEGYGDIWLSSNAGGSWTKSSLPTAMYWHAAMSAAGAHIAVAAQMGAGVYDGRIYVSNDGGANWVESVSRQVLRMFYIFP